MNEKTEEMRTFVAIDLPADVHAFLHSISSDLRKAGGDVKWVRAESIHLTLKFLGNVRGEILPDLETEIAAALCDQNIFDLQIIGLGAFPSLKSPRVVWAGLRDQSNSLALAVKRLEDRLERLGFPKEQRPFSPHLTLGRFRSSKGNRDLIEALRQGMDVSGPSFTANHAVLFRSVLKPSGAEYTALKRFDFQGA
jgi:RNA 2',3'-cyclic 3'-phosphodiesterase